MAPVSASKAPFTDGFTCGSMARTASPESSLTPSTPLLLARAASDLTAAISSSENASTSEPLRRYAKPRLSAHRGYSREPSTLKRALSVPGRGS